MQQRLVLGILVTWPMVNICAVWADWPLEHLLLLKETLSHDSAPNIVRSHIFCSTILLECRENKDIGLLFPSRNTSLPKLNANK
jgi:hypothetical protein